MPVPRALRLAHQVRELPAQHLRAVVEELLVGDRGHRGEGQQFTDGGGGEGGRGERFHGHGDDRTRRH
ncbi:hypothetical protein [Streptomyces purpureus]|uniref:hypothetical protein n=1 Tax=Streptomyces purpureus TaxID=1951 RepID=UPI0016713D93|nr:hypothetical protein [Streptomyces purpureus]